MRPTLCLAELLGAKNEKAGELCCSAGRSNLGGCGFFPYPPPGQQHVPLSMAACWNRFSTLIMKCVEDSPMKRILRPSVVIVVVTIANLCIASTLSSQFRKFLT